VGDGLPDKWLGLRHSAAILLSELRQVNAKRSVRRTEKILDQVALPPDAGFGEDAFDLRVSINRAEFRHQKALVGDSFVSPIASNGASSPGH
jgi:hypothetical protein